MAHEVASKIAPLEGVLTKTVSAPLEGVLTKTASAPLERVSMATVLPEGVLTGTATSPLEAAMIRTAPEEGLTETAPHEGILKAGGDSTVKNVTKPRMSEMRRNSLLSQARLSTHPEPPNPPSGTVVNFEPLSNRTPSVCFSVL